MDVYGVRLVITFVNAEFGGEAVTTQENRESDLGELFSKSKKLLNSV